MSIRGTISGLTAATATARDGASIAYYRVESSRRAAPTLVLCGGLGAAHEVWAPQIAYLRDRFGFLTWDYRGLFSSKLPPQYTGPALDVHVHLRDLACVLDAAGVRECSLIGWSTGVQLALEAYHHLRGRVQSLVLIAGAAGRTLGHIPWRGALPRVIAAGMRPELVGAATALRRWLGVPFPGLDAELAGRLAARSAELDPKGYAATLAAFMSHDASSLVPEIDVPALCIAGDRDPLTPVVRVHELARNLRRSEMLIVRGAGHFVALEYADLVNLRIEQFLRDAGLW